MKLPDLPILDALPALISAMRSNGMCVLQAPPGAGKTTVVPLALLDDQITNGKILMLEPRRLAARAAAERLAETLGEKTGETVGYRVRGEARISKQTRIEVVTEGILTRMIQSDPSLDGIGAVIFDEFHERSLNGDLGLALTWEIRGALRPDLLVLVMSATLDAGPVADMLGAPVVTSHGRAFPVDTKWLDRPLAKTTRLEAAVADLIGTALGETSGGVLVFLPGEGEIRRVASRLQGHLPPDCVVHPLFGSMDLRAQRAAIAPAASGRKIVLATSIAETSLTIQDIRVVVDGGRARRARFDPGSGMSQLVTERVSKAEADQRRGRAGRVAAGVCYRLWTKGEEGGLPAFPPAEIEAADLSNLVLELALWGTTDIATLAFLTPPKPVALENARTLLTALSALDDAGRITAHGRVLAALPLHPRLAHMMRQGGGDAAELAALLSDRDPLIGAPVDLSLRRDAIRDVRRFSSDHPIEVNRGALERIKSEATRLRKSALSGRGGSWAELAARAFPDRIGLRRPGEAPRWILSGGKGAKMDPGDPMAGARLIVATNLDGDRQEARVRQGIAISEGELRGLFADQIKWNEVAVWSKRERRVRALRQECFGALVLAEQVWKSAPDDALIEAALDGVRDIGLPISNAARRFCARVELVRAGSMSLPDMSEDGLVASLEDWLAPHLAGVKTESDIKKLDILEPLRQSLSWAQLQELDRLAPAHFVTPMGNKTPIDYGGDAPEISLRLQELFGVTEHPVVGTNRTPIKITLLSPARRPVQTTADLPGFWATSYGDVRRDMRGQYPKHPWPEDPTIAEPTLRAKPRKRS